MILMYVLNIAWHIRTLQKYIGCLFEIQIQLATLYYYLLNPATPVRVNQQLYFTLLLLNAYLPPLYFSMMLQFNLHL